MPTYDYECEACGHHFERWQEMSARKLRTCPECGKRKLVRLVGAGAGVIFKGSGFYETDYKRKLPARSGGSGSSEGAASKSKDGADASSSSSSGSSASSTGAGGDAKKKRTKPS